MRTYGSSYAEVMSLRMPVFWHLSGMVPRLLNTENKEALRLMTLSHNPEEASKAIEALDKMTPEPVALTGAARMLASAEADKGGIDELRSLAG